MGRKRAGALGACLAGLAAAVTVWAQSDQPPRYRVEVRLVRMLATVKDLQGQLVGGLSKDDFTVFDNGVPQQITLFSQTTEAPLSVAMLVDTSGSTGIKLREETGSVTRFLNTLLGEENQADQLALYSFSHDVIMEHNFTRDVPALEHELKQMKPDAGTSLYDAVYFASRALESREGRRVILVVTDGADTTSGKNFHAAIEAAHDADTAIYGIMIIPVTSDAGRHIAGENALITMCVDTGGKVFAAALGDMLDSAFSDILRDLRSQYLLGYYPRNVPYTHERFHRIQVKMKRADLRVVTRTGYYGDYGDSAQEDPVSQGPIRLIP